MRYTLEYKLKCIQMYRQGIWPETPEGIKNPQDFHKMIRRWKRIEEHQGVLALNHKHHRKQADNLFITFTNETSEQKVVNNIYKVINEKKRLGKTEERNDNFSGLIFLNFEKDNNRTVLYRFDRDGKALRLDNPSYENLKNAWKM